MNFLTHLLFLSSNYIAPIAFLGAILGGEEILVLLSILAAQGFFSIYTMFIFFYIGILVSDFIWFFIGKYHSFNWLKKKKFIANTFNKAGNLLDKLSSKKKFQALLITKFLYGLRIPTIVYLARHKMPAKKFLIYSIILNLAWVSIITLLGFSAGKGIALAQKISNNIVLALFLIGLTLLLFTLFIKWISNLVKKKLQEENN